MPSSVPNIHPQMLLALQMEQPRTDPLRLPVEVAFRWVARPGRDRRHERVFFARDAETLVNRGASAAHGLVCRDPAAMLTLEAEALFVRPDAKPGQRWPGREWRGVGPDRWPAEFPALRAELSRLAESLVARAVELLNLPDADSAAA